MGIDCLRAAKRGPLRGVLEASGVEPQRDSTYAKLRSRGYTGRAMMTRRLAQKNIRTGLIVAAICMFMFGLTFIVAALYIS
jgi:hypothetical protein